MGKRYLGVLLMIRILSDLLMVSGAWIAAYYLRFSEIIPAPKGIPDAFLYLKLLPFIATIWLVVFAASGFYARSGRHRSPFVEALDILQSCIFATMAFVAFIYVYEEYRYSRITTAIFAGLHPWMIIAGRSLIRKIIRRQRRLSPPRRALVIGSGESFRHALDLGQLDTSARGEIAGVILIGPQAELSQSALLAKELGLKVLIQPTDWVAFFSQHEVHTVVIALPHRSYDFIEQNLEQIADQVPDVKLIPDLMRFTKFAAGIDVVAGTPVINIHESPLAGFGGVTKRVIDVLGSAAGLALLSPVMAAIALSIKFTSRGPIFYRQERMGLDGRTFEMLKFRSMPVDAEAGTGPVWATEQDNRPTKIGALLRRSSLDELPQLFNVLRGDMSLVGPRPERPVFVAQFRRKVPGYYLRHKVKAGCTGWAQINGWRGNTSIEKRIECDLFYIQNWSLWFDVRIIFLTVFRGFINKNAY